MRIYDTFLFFNELDLLELRLRTLEDVVDQFVLVEGQETFRGDPKPSYFLDNKSRFKRWNIQRVQVKPLVTNPWEREYAARNAMLPRDARPNDFIFQSDCDEIWEPSSVDALSDELVITFAMRQFYYALNAERVPRIKWPGTRRTRKKHWITGQALRVTNGVAVEGGWHFSFLGDAENAATKMKAYAHSEYSGDRWTNAERLAQKIETGEDMIQPGVFYRPVPVGDDFPEPLKSGQWDKYIRAA